MSWLPDGHDQKVKEKLAAFTQEQRDSLTWSQAFGLANPGTVQWARWRRIRVQEGITPWKALCVFYGIGEQQK